MIKKNDIIEVNILNLGCNGEGVAKYDGVVLFVPFALPNERVRVQVINTKQKAYICKIVEVIEPSPYRVEELCPYYKKCGGCQLQHLDYNNACDFKRKLVQDAITHIGKCDAVVDNCVPSDCQYYYRNKLALPVDRQSRSVGMYRTASHSIVPIEFCYIQKECFRKVIEAFNNYLKLSDVSIYSDDDKTGLIRHLVIRESNNKFLVTVVVNGDNLVDEKILIEELVKCDVEFGLNININKTASNVILTNDFVHIFGLENIQLEEYGVKYDINNASFMQVNDYIKHKIYDNILAEIDKNDIVVDSYSGAGLLTAIMSKACKMAYGIEIVEPAVDIANGLKEYNKISNMENICGDASVELPKLVKRIKEDFVAVIDPPRKGCSEVVIGTLAKVRPKKIIYVSCNPSTLARDVYNFRKLTDKYNIKSIQPFDMFPNTKHVETLLVMERK